MSYVITIGEITKKVKAKLISYQYDVIAGVGRSIIERYYEDSGKEVTLGFFQYDITVNPSTSAKMDKLLSDAVSENPIT